MKRGLTFAVLGISIILMLSVSLVSAGWWSSITGRASGRNTDSGEIRSQEQWLEENVNLEKLDKADRDKAWKCFDSDNGANDLHFKSFADKYYYTGDGEIFGRIRHWDTCSGIKIRETECYNNEPVFTDEIDCPEGEYCLGGACLKAATCTEDDFDSNLPDPGKNRNKKGTTTDTLGNIHEDECLLDSVTGKRSPRILIEGYCKKYGVNSSIVDTEFMICPGFCEGGKCDYWDDADRSQKGDTPWEKFKRALFA